jgi:hypothetical protein
LFEPTGLDKKFSYKDCEINASLDPVVRKRLVKILEENKSAFAVSKLDVGKFKGLANGHPARHYGRYTTRKTKIII